MKLRLVRPLLLALCVTLGAIPATAGSYDNGPLFGDSDGSPTINFGFIVSNTFVFLQNQQVSSFEFSVWLFPGDVGAITSAELSITSQPNGGTVYFDQMLTGWFLGSGGCILNEFGYYNCDEQVNFNGPMLNGGTTYWVNIQNAHVPSNDPIYWDQNFGMNCGGDDGLGGGCPSLAYESGVGTIPSETFTIYGREGGTVPEPSSVLLVGSGILAVVGVMRRKLF